MNTDLSRVCLPYSAVVSGNVQLEWATWRLLQANNVAFLPILV